MDRKTILDDEEKNITANLSLHIPEDVTAEILSRLPIKSIGRFMLVSKNWRDIIRSRGFSSMNAKNKPFSTFYAGSPLYDPSLFLYDDRRDGHVVEVSDSAGKYVTTTIPRRGHPELMSESGKMQIVGSCNGLLFLLGLRVGFEAGIVIFNPITDEITTIALPNHDDDGRIVEPNKGYDHIFGYSPSTNEYKILSIRHGTKVRNPYAIFTIGVDKRWRKLSPRLFPRERMTTHSDTVLCNGAFHWLVADGPNYYILAFDIAEEKTRRMWIPPLRHEGGLRLLLLNNRLSLSTRSYLTHGRRSSVIRKMEDYGDGDSWSQIVVPQIRFFVRPRNSGISVIRYRVPIRNEADDFEPLGCATKYGGILFRGARRDHLELYCPKKKTYARIQVPYNAEVFFEFNPNFSSIHEILYGGSRARATQ